MNASLDGIGCSIDPMLASFRTVLVAQLFPIAGLPRNIPSRNRCPGCTTSCPVRTPICRIGTSAFVPCYAVARNGTLECAENRKGRSHDRSRA
jgi:hypothetical protein